MNLGAFDELGVFEAGSGADEGNEVRLVHGAPTGLGGLDELDHHGQGGGAGAGKPFFLRLAAWSFFSGMTVAVADHQTEDLQDL